MGGALENPKRPFVAILGGAKVSDKIGVINNLIEKVDTLIIGGGMAYTFFKALGHEIGTSICEDDKVELAKEMMDKAKAKGINFLIPVDNVVATEYSADSEWKIVDSDDIPEGWMGLDIGPKSRELFGKRNTRTAASRRVSLTRWAGLRHRRMPQAGQQNTARMW